MAEAAFGGALAQPAADADTSARHMRTSEARTGRRIDEVLTGLWYAKSGRTDPMTCVSHRSVPGCFNNVREFTEQCGTISRAGSDVLWFFFMASECRAPPGRA